MPPGSPPPQPPGWLQGVSLPIDIVPAGQPLFRVHRHNRGAIHFNRDPVNRFDPTDRSYGVLYAGIELEASFVETLLRNPHLRLVDQAEVDERRWSELACARDLRMARLYGKGLSAMGATAEVSTGDYATSRAWAKAIRDHRDAVDGILYMSRHDNQRLCAAIFERDGIGIRTVGGPHHFRDDWLTDTLRSYGKALDT